MNIIRTWNDLAHALDSPLHPTAKSILIGHRERLAEFDDLELSDLAAFFIFEPGDQPADLMEASGIAILDDPPDWEYLHHHDGWFECCFIISDDGFGWIVMIPDWPGTDPALLELCRTYA